MADIEKCKIDGFIAFHIQVRGHFTKKHPELSYEEYTKNIEVLGNLMQTLNDTVLDQA